MSLLPIVADAYLRSVNLDFGLVINAGENESVCLIPADRVLDSSFDTF